MAATPDLARLDAGAAAPASTARRGTQLADDGSIWRHSWSHRGCSRARSDGRGPRSTHPARSRAVSRPAAPCRDPMAAGIDPETGSTRRGSPMCRHPVTSIADRSIGEQLLLATDRVMVRMTMGEARDQIELAHEALLRQWGSVVRLLEEDFAVLTTLEGVKWLRAIGAQTGEGKTGSIMPALGLRMRTNRCTRGPRWRPVDRRPRLLLECRTREVAIERALPGAAGTRARGANDDCATRRRWQPQTGRQRGVLGSVWCRIGVCRARLLAMGFAWRNQLAERSASAAEQGQKRPPRRGLSRGESTWCSARRSADNLAEIDRR